MLQGSLVALVTPMDAHGAVDDRALAGLVEFHVAAGTAGLVVAGTSGESATLARDEHCALIARVVELARGRIPVIAGTGSNSTAQTLDLSVAVGQLGIAGFLLVTPYYNKPTQEGLYRHFVAVADAVDKPIMLYNVPGRTAVDMLPETVARLATHPRITALKDATGNVARVRPQRELCGPGFGLYSGDDATTCEFILAGGNGAVSVTANVAPALMQRMCVAALQGDRVQATGLNERLAALHAGLFVESNPIPAKWALCRMGLIGPGIRLPLTWLSEHAQHTVEEALQRAGVTLT
jgi:4-hydroxy-tetrahydrodipicolinate synthase